MEKYRIAPTIRADRNRLRRKRSNRSLLFISVLLILMGAAYSLSRHQSSFYGICETEKAFCFFSYTPPFI